MDGAQQSDSCPKTTKKTHLVLPHHMDKAPGGQWGNSANKPRRFVWNPKIIWNEADRRNNILDKIKKTNTSKAAFIVE